MVLEKTLLTFLTWLLSGTSLVISIAAFLGKWGFKELSAKNKMRRDFGANTAKRIAELADQHYWAIATAAGMLSTGLRAYLERIEMQLYVDFESGTKLKQVVQDVAIEASFVTFPSLVQLLWSLHTFQFLGSNDYLLPQYEAGVNLRRLYNSFRASLTFANSKEDDLATSVLLRIEGKDGKFDVQAALKSASNRSMDKPDQLDDPDMEVLRAAWARWLAGNLANVLSATRYLETFSRVLQQQITELYCDWYDSRKPSRFDLRQRDTTWGVLSPTDQKTLAAARAQNDLMFPLRQAARGPAALIAPPSQKALPPKPDDMWKDSADTQRPSSAPPVGDDPMIVPPRDRGEERRAAAPPVGAEPVIRPNEPYVNPEDAVELRSMDGSSR
jgi:hypothetical protein